MTPIDQADRERALDPTRSFIVQAPAGSGKTELLIQRYLRLLSEVERPESVVAITFTKKAAAEMRRRVLQALDAAGLPAPEREHEKRTWELARAVLERGSGLGWELADNPRRLAIRTIDSLCSSLANRMPWLSRLGPPPEIVEKADDMYREAGRRTVELLETEEYAEPIGRLLRHVDNNQQKLTKLLAVMLAHRDQWLRHVVGMDRGRLRERYEGMLRHKVVSELERLRDAAPQCVIEHAAALAKHAAYNLQGSDKNLEILACRELSGLPGADERDLPLWRGLATLFLTADDKPRAKVDKSVGFPTTSKREKDQMSLVLGELRNQQEFYALLGKARQLPTPRFEDSQWEVLEAMLVALPAAAGQLRLVFGERGQVDFAALTEAASHALGEDEAPTELALALDGRIEHLLVDEFQDTSYSQMSLLEKLTAGWTPGDGRTLFLVGDPMQSIYRFREAEVGLFLRTAASGLTTVEVESLKLSLNFRSRSNVVDWVNRVFPEVFGEQEDFALGAMRFLESSCASTEAPGPEVAIHPFFDPPGVEEDGQPAAEANRVREIVERARKAGKSVAVLARARTHLPRILAELREAGIGYQALEIDRLDSSPAVRDLLALTSALLHPGDRLSWLAILRAPWCGLSLADLHALTADATKAAVPALLAQAERLGRLSPDARARIERVLRAIGPARPRTLRAWVEGVWLRLGGPATIVSAAGLDDAEAYFDLLEKLDRGCDVDLSALRANVQELFASPDPSAVDGVQVMTIHKAKGLEFDVVILPGLARPSATDDDKLLLWLETPAGDRLGESDVLLAPIKSDASEMDAVYSWVRNLEAEKERHELARLLYVAATRARSELHLLGAVKLSTKNGAPNKPARGTLLHRLWHGVESHFATAGAAAPATPPRSRPALSLRRLASDWSSPFSIPAAAPTAPLEPEKFDTRYRWAAERRRLIGTVVHDLLQEIAREGVESWDEERVRGSQPRYGKALRAAGVAGDDLAKAIDQVERAILNTLSDERGRWILDATHEEARSEVALAGVVGGRVVERRVDRTFIDKDRVRWVIDFKTSPKDRRADAEGFVRLQMERYRQQMEDYRAFYRQLEKRPVRIGLYFPLLGVWREYEETASAAV